MHQKTLLDIVSLKYPDDYLFMQEYVWSANHQPVRFVVNNHGLFTAGWFGVKEKYYFNL